MNFLISENKLNDIISSYLDKVTKDIVIKKGSRSINFEFPGADKYQMSLFDYGPHYQKYWDENKNMHKIPKNPDMAFWVDCTFVEEIEAMFSLDYKSALLVIKNWATKKYDLKIDYITCQ